MRSGEAKRVEYHITSKEIDGDVVAFIASMIPNVAIYRYNSFDTPMSKAEMVRSELPPEVQKGRMLARVAIDPKDYWFEMTRNGGEKISELLGYQDIQLYVLSYVETLRNAVDSVIERGEMKEWLDILEHVELLLENITGINSLLWEIERTLSRGHADGHLDLVNEYYNELSSFKKFKLDHLIVHTSRSIELLTELLSELVSESESSIGLMRENIQVLAMTSLFSVVQREYGPARASEIVFAFIGDLNEALLRFLTVSPDKLVDFYRAWVETGPTVLSAQEYLPATDAERSLAMDEINKRMNAAAVPTINWKQQRDNGLANKNVRTSLVAFAAEVRSLGREDGSSRALLEDIGNLTLALSGQMLPETARIPYQTRKPDTYFNTNKDGGHLINLMVRFLRLSA